MNGEKKKKDEQKEKLLAMQKGKENGSRDGEKGLEPSVRERAAASKLCGQSDSMPAPRDDDAGHRRRGGVRGEGLGLALVLLGRRSAVGFFLTAKFKMGLKVFVSSTPEKADRVARLLLNWNQKMKSNWP
ncbi:hypothetical protein Celaphus_00017832 [Cervus elaphus hippelaphus]|uniref:Uncharacterized protein n=1 Tax=Cervus elaphus hippelaphus TaxID=46360 RepID=A0A212C7A6_CEREH|nr:hypothetical protein Celaphus_00017832 [Cervus elaphus hippelaphus]